MQGQPAESVAIAQRPARFQIMFYGTMCSDLRFPRPAYCWTKESLIEKTDSMEKLAKINTYWVHKAEEQLGMIIFLE
jgi:hypothetical protein